MRRVRAFLYKNGTKMEVSRLLSQKKNGEASRLFRLFVFTLSHAHCYILRWDLVEVEAVIFVHGTCKHKLYAIHSLVLTVCKKDNPNNY